MNGKALKKYRIKILTMICAISFLLFFSPDLFLPVVAPLSRHCRRQCAKSKLQSIHEEEEDVRTSSSFGEHNNDGGDSGSQRSEAPEFLHRNLTSPQNQQHRTEESGVNDDDDEAKKVLQFGQNGKWQNACKITIWGLKFHMGSKKDEIYANLFEEWSLTLKATQKYIEFLQLEQNEANTAKILLLFRKFKNAKPNVAVKPKFAFDGTLLRLLDAMELIQRNIEALAKGAGIKTEPPRVKVQRAPEFVNKQQWMFVNNLITVYLPRKESKKEATKALKICKASIKRSETFENFNETLMEHPELNKFAK